MLESQFSQSLSLLSLVRHFNAVGNAFGVSDPPALPLFGVYRHAPNLVYVVPEIKVRVFQHIR